MQGKKLMPLLLRGYSVPSEDKILLTAEAVLTGEILPMDHVAAPLVRINLEVGIEPISEPEAERLMQDFADSGKTGGIVPGEFAHTKLLESSQEKFQLLS